MARERGRRRRGRHGRRWRRPAGTAPGGGERRRTTSSSDRLARTSTLHGQGHVGAAAGEPGPQGLAGEGGHLVGPIGGAFHDQRVVHAEGGQHLGVGADAGPQLAVGGQHGVGHPTLDGGVAEGVARRPHASTAAARSSPAAAPGPASSEPADEGPAQRPVVEGSAQGRPPTGRPVPALEPRRAHLDQAGLRRCGGGRHPGPAQHGGGGDREPAAAPGQRPRRPRTGGRRPSSTTASSKCSVHGATSGWASSTSRRLGQRRCRSRNSRRSAETSTRSS